MDHAGMFPHIPRLLMRFQQRDLDAIAGQECRCG